jgi:hypothetical protein
MCDHCWKASIPESRLYVLKCPNCLSDQPGDDEISADELREQAEKCEQVLGAAAAERKKANMVARARLRMSKGPWTPQLASAHDRALAMAHARD